MNTNSYLTVMNIIHLNQQDNFLGMNPSMTRSFASAVSLLHINRCNTLFTVSDLTLSNSQVPTEVKQLVGWSVESCDHIRNIFSI